MERVLDGDDGVAGGHGLHHPAGRDVAEEGQEEEKDRGGCPASHGEGCGKCECSRPNYQIEDVHSRSSGRETSRGLVGHLGPGNPRGLFFVILSRYCQSASQPVYIVVRITKHVVTIKDKLSSVLKLNYHLSYSRYT